MGGGMSAKATTPRSGTDGQIALTDYLEAFEPHVRRIVTEIRKVVRDLAPEAREKAYRGWGLYVTSDRGSVGISAFRDHVNVNLPASAALRDPEGLLEGSGKTQRHAKVRSVEEARRQALRDLIRQVVTTGPRRLSIREGRGERILERVRAICLAMPDVSERLSHGTPTWFAGGKQFAQVWAGHHDDRGLQMWCAAPSGAQPALVKADPDRFFVPPYVGHRGWLGVRLDKRVDWAEMERIVGDAHAEVAGR
jgi:hypothetical protein